MLSINTNIASQVASSTLSDVSDSMTQTMAQLSTGKNAVDALTGDDAYVINLESQEKSLGQFVKNAQDGLNLVNVASATVNEARQMLEQMKVLAQQSANGIYTQDDRNGFQTKFSELNQEVNESASRSTFNNVGLANASTTVTIFINDASSLGIDVGLVNLTTGSSGLDIANLNISTQSGAIQSISTLTSALTEVASASTSYASVAQTLQYSMNSLVATQQNISRARASVEDTDYAAATSNLAKQNVLKSAGTAMLVQANQAPQAVLQLLRS